MSQTNNAAANNLFKKVYGKIKDLQPQDHRLAEDFPFEEKQKVGESYSEAVVLTAETGITFGGSVAEAIELNPAVAGAVKQALVSSYISALPSVIPMGIISRSLGSEQAFLAATKHVMKNNLKSHGKFLEIARLYGQSTELLGYVSYATATYRGVSFAIGAGVLNGITFTAGVNTSSKYILLKPGDFASGIWVGMEGVQVQQINSSNVVVAEGSLTEVNSEYGYIGVDFTPVAATSTTSHRLCFKGMAEANEMIGIKKILTTSSGTLFGINVASYSLWKGNSIAVGSQKFSFDVLQAGIAQAVNRGGLDGDVIVYVNPRTWGKLITTEAGLRHYDSSYKANAAENGAESIVFHHQAGKSIIRSHRLLKEGDACGLHVSDWSRSGSAEIAFEIPGMAQDVIYPLENQLAYKFMSFADQYMFCNAPARSLWFSGINDESNS